MIDILIKSGIHISDDYPDYINPDFYLMVDNGEITELMCDSDIDYLLAKEGMYKKLALANNAYQDKEGLWFKNIEDAQNLKRTIQNYIKLNFGLVSK